MLKRLSRAHTDELLSKLCMQRKMTPIIDRHLAVATTKFEKNTENWVHMWLDPDQVVKNECGEVTAHRGITVQGELLWLVRHKDKKMGYHSAAIDPIAGIEEALFAWEERRRIRQRWDEVELLAKAARKGQYRQTVHIEDAFASPLCETGVRHFMTRIGLRRYTRPGVGRLSARNVARLMRLEQQAGFVLMTAFERRHGDKPVSVIL